MIHYEFLVNVLCFDKDLPSLVVLKAHRCFAFPFRKLKIALFKFTAPIVGNYTVTAPGYITNILRYLRCINRFMKFIKYTIVNMTFIKIFLDARVKRYYKFYIL